MYNPLISFALTEGLDASGLPQGDLAFLPVLKIRFFFGLLRIFSYPGCYFRQPFPLFVVSTMAHYFFPSTASATDQITELFTFVWPTAAALWNLRWQVNGFLEELETLPTPDQLNDRFVFGSGIHGADLKKACVDTTWDEQKHHLAGVILTNAFAAYEHWADEILQSLGMSYDKGKYLQYDNGPTDARGLRGTVHALCATESKVIKAAFYPSYASSPKYSWPLIANMMSAYRLFKELRNSQIHNGGVASKKAADAYRAFAPVSSKADLGMKGALIHDPIAEGDKIKLHIRGVVGLCDILFRMMVTVDAELCRSARAESILESRFKGARLRQLTSGNPHRQKRQINDFCRSARLPKCNDTQLVRQFLISKRLIKF